MVVRNTTETYRYITIGNKTEEWLTNRKNLFFLTCFPWSYRLRPKILYASMTVPPAPVRVPGQRPLAPRITSVTSVAKDKGDNEMIPGAVHRSPGIYLPYSWEKNQKTLARRPSDDQSSPQIGSLSSKWCRLDRTARQDGKRRKKEGSVRYFCCFGSFKFYHIWSHILTLGFKFRWRSLEFSL